LTILLFEMFYDINGENMSNMKLSGVLLCVSVSLVIGACARSTELVGMSLNDFPTAFNRKSEALDFDAEIVVGHDTKDYLYGGSAKRIIFNKRSVIPLIIHEGVNLDSMHSDNYYYMFDNGNNLYMNNDYISFSSNSELQVAINSSFGLFTSYYTADRFSIRETPDDFSKLAGKDEIEKLLLDLKIKNADLFKCYVLDYQTLQENEQHIAPDGTDRTDRYKTGWSEADNSNYWLGIERWQGIPVFCPSFYGGMNDTWAPIQVLYTKDGIEEVQVLYSFEFIQSNKKIMLKSFDTIADVMIKNYSMLLTDNKHLVTKAELFFMVDTNQMDVLFSIVPVWVLTVHEYAEGKKARYKEYNELINAETAKILEVGN
jgi:hypothetical protein